MRNFASTKKLVLAAILLLVVSPAIGGKDGLTTPLDKAAKKYIATACQQKVLSSGSVNYKTCIEQQRNNLKPLIRAFKKYASNRGFIGGWCGTEEVRQALGIKTFPFYPRPSFKGEETFWSEIRKTDGWVVYALHDAWAKPIPKVPLVAIKENTIQIKKSNPADNGFGAGIYCLGSTGKAVNNNWFGFPVDVYYYDAIYP